MKYVQDFSLTLLVTTPKNSTNFQMLLAYKQGNSMLQCILQSIKCGIKDWEDPNMYKRICQINLKSDDHPHDVDTSWPPSSSCEIKNQNHIMLAYLK